MTTEQIQLLDSASDEAIIGYVLKWINQVLESITVGPAARFIGDGDDPIHDTLVDRAPMIRECEVFLDMTRIKIGIKQDRWFPHPFFVQYYIHKFDAGERF